MIRDSLSGGIVYLPPEAADVPGLMAALVAWVGQAEKDGLPAPLIAGLVHYRRSLRTHVTIHPYLRWQRAHRPSAGGALTISAAQQGAEVAIAVQDSGVGIPAENMGKLFDPLFTTKAKGIGLGLAVSQKLVEANGGKIEVESEPGKGSSFTVFLPGE